MTERSGFCVAAAFCSPRTRPGRGISAGLWQGSQEVVVHYAGLGPAGLSGRVAHGAKRRLIREAHRFEHRPRVMEDDAQVEERGYTDGYLGLRD